MSNADTIKLVKTRWTEILGRYVAVAAIVAGFVLLFRKAIQVNPTTVALTLLLCVLLVSAYWGLRYALALAVFASISFNYFFLPPVGTFTIADPQNWVALLAFLVTAITGSQLSVHARRRAAEAIARRQEVERLYALGQAMLLSGSVRSAARDAVNSIIRTFEVPAAVFYSKVE